MKRSTFEEPRSADILPALAPFDVFEDTGLALRFLMAAGPKSAQIDPYFGSITVTWLDGVVTECCPWELLRDESAAEILQGLGKIREAAIRSRILQIWSAMVSALDAVVERGDMKVVAREGSALAKKLTAIPSSVWRLFKIEDWERAVAVCPETGERLYDVYFRPSKQPAHSMQGTDPVPKVNKGGRPPKSDWPLIKDLLRTKIKEIGSYPEKEGPQNWRTQNDAINFVRECVKDRKERVQLSALRDNTRRILDELKGENLVS